MNIKITELAVHDKDADVMDGIEIDTTANVAGKDNADLEQQEIENGANGENGENEEPDTPEPAEDDFGRGDAFEKLDLYDKYLDDPNPWHPDLGEPLFDAQIVGFRWMIDRHKVGGGLVADKVGVGKVSTPTSWKLTYV
jgi:SNF2 family DNA or RNA helicase